MTADILGWDVGGANIKIARIDPRTPAAPAAIEQPFPLWRDFNRLPSMLAALAGRIVEAGDGASHDAPPAAMAITMTAELADCFATKRDGVAFVVGAFEQAFPRSILWVFGS